MPQEKWLVFFTGFFCFLSVLTEKDSPFSSDCSSQNPHTLGNRCYHLVTHFVNELVLAGTTHSTTEGLIYKGHPLRRAGNLIYYGTMAEKYIIMMQVLETKKEQDLELASKVSIQLQLTDPDLKSRDRVVKKSEKDSLYAAMDIATVWLNRALAGKEK